MQIPNRLFRMMAIESWAARRENRDIWDRPPAEPFSIIPGTFGDALVLQHPWSPAIGDYMRTHNIRELVLSWHAGWMEKRADFLADAPELDALLWDPYFDEEIDASALHTQASLRVLELHADKYPGLDLSRFRKLERCALDMELRESKSVFECPTLRELEVLYLKDKQAERLCALQNLERLKVVYGPLKSLEHLAPLKKLRTLHLEHTKRLRDFRGLEPLQALRWIRTHECDGMRSLDGLEELAKLETLEMEQSERVKSVEPIRTCEGLRMLSLYLGKVDTIEPVRKLKNLEFLEIRQKSQDGDYSAVKELSKLWILHLPLILSKLPMARKQFPNLFYGHPDQLLEVLPRMYASDLPAIRKRVPQLQWLLDRMIANNKTMGEHGLYANPETGEESFDNLDLWPYDLSLVTEAREENYVTNDPNYRFAPKWDPKPYKEYQPTQQAMEAHENAEETTDS